MAKKPRKPVKEKGPFKIPKTFELFGNEWFVEHRWGLMNDDGKEVPVLVKPDEHMIIMDRGLALDDKPQVFMKAMLDVVLSQHVTLNENTNVLSNDLADFICDTFNLRWRKSNA